MIIAPLLVNPLQTISRYFVLKVVNSFIPAAIASSVTALITSVYSLYSTVGFFKSIQLILRLREALRVKASIATLKEILFRGSMPATAAQTIYALAATDWVKILKYVPYVYRAFNILLIGFALIIVLNPLLIWLLRGILTLLFTAIGIMYTPSLKAIKWLKKYSLMVLSFTPLGLSQVVENSPALTNVKIIIEEPITESKWKQGVIAVLVILGIILTIDHFKPDTPVVHDIAKGTKATLNFIGVVSVAISTVASYPFVASFNYLKSCLEAAEGPWRPTRRWGEGRPNSPGTPTEITLNDIRTSNANAVHDAAQSGDPDKIKNLDKVIQPIPESRVEALVDNTPQIPPVCPPVSSQSTSRAANASSGPAEGLGGSSTTRPSHSNSVTNDDRAQSPILLSGYELTEDGDDEGNSSGSDKGRTSPRLGLSSQIQAAMDYVSGSNSTTPKPAEQSLPDTSSTLTKEELEKDVAWSKVNLKLTKLNLNSEVLNKIKEADPETLRTIVSRVGVKMDNGLFAYNIEGYTLKREEALKIIHQTYDKWYKEGGVINHIMKSVVKSVVDKKSK